MSDLERRRAAVNDVKSRTDEHEIRKELQEKLSIAERDKSFKKENKKTLARYKRHQSIKSRDDARVLLSDQLLTYFEQIKQVHLFFVKLNLKYYETFIPFARLAGGDN